jgi:hypothetical protein
MEQSVPQNIFFILMWEQSVPNQYNAGYSPEDKQNKTAPRKC